MTLLRNPSLLGGRIIQPDNGVLRPWSPVGGGLINSFSAFEDLFPPVYGTAPVIPHGDPYSNYCPVGWVIDPLDDRKFLLYVSQFMQNEDDSSKVAVYGGWRSEPSVVTYIGDVLEKGAPGSWDARGVYISGCQFINDNGIIRVVYSGRENSTDYCKLGAASSVDGRTFTKFAGNPIVSPPIDHRDPAGGYQTGMLCKVDGTYYFYITVVDTNPVLVTSWALMNSADFEAWTDLGAFAGLPADLGTGEAGTALLLGSDMVFLYDVSAGLDGHPYYHMNLASSSSPTGTAVVSSKRPILSLPDRHVAGFIVANPQGNKWVGYYTRHDGSGLMNWDVYMATLQN